MQIRCQKGAGTKMHKYLVGKNTIKQKTQQLKFWEKRNHDHLILGMFLH